MSFFMQRDALVDGNYRYTLTRTWSHKQVYRLLFIGLNPSIADKNIDDATVRILVGRARRLNLDGLTVVNLFAFISTFPAGLRLVADPIGPWNDLTILEHCQQQPVILVGWGDGGLYQDRAAEVVSMLYNQQIHYVHCLGLTAKGQPKHPLRIPYSQPLMKLSTSASGELVGAT